MTNIHDMLRQDHDDVKAQLNELEMTTNAQAEERGEIFAKLKRALDTHTQFEEDHFYPTVRKTTGMEGEIADDLKEHKEADELLATIEEIGKSNPLWLDKIEQLKKALEHHIDDEEQKLFPASREKMSEAQMEELGEKYHQMKEKAGLA